MLRCQPTRTLMNKSIDQSALFHSQEKKFTSSSVKVGWKWREHIDMNFKSTGEQNTGILFFGGRSSLKNMNILMLNSACKKKKQMKMKKSPTESLQSGACQVCKCNFKKKFWLLRLCLEKRTFLLSRRWHFYLKAFNFT